MINIIFPLNKSVVPEYKYWVSFLNSVQKKLYKEDISITYLLFSNNLAEVIKAKIIINGEIHKNHYLSISEIESKFKFSLKELLYIDYLQTSKHVINTRDRDWYIPESEFKDDVVCRIKLNQIIDTFNNEKYDFVLADQGTDFEMTFIHRLCIDQKIPFVRYLPDFGNRCFFAYYKNHSKIKILDINIGELDESQILNKVKSFTQGKNSNIYQMSDKNLAIYNPYPPRSLFKRIVGKTPQQLVGSLQLKVKDYYFRNTEEFTKQNLYSHFDKSKKYIFYGLHLTTESHVALHSYPYLNQIITIEQISRALPRNYLLYVKPHPWWSHTISRKDLKKLKNIPFVRILRPSVPIRDIIKHAGLITTLNATTGIEALALGKPVIALSKVNAYTGFHPNALRCDDLYDLPGLIVKLLSKKNDNTSTDDYFKKLFSISSDLRFEAERFCSHEDADEKAEKFSDMVKKVISLDFN